MEITSEAQLREVLGGYPTKRVATKAHSKLHPLEIEWLRVSPFCVISTCDAQGNCDASPKGDPAGHLIHVLDPGTVAIAERRGNKRADGYLNVLSNPHAGHPVADPRPQRHAPHQRAGQSSKRRAVL